MNDTPTVTDTTPPVISGTSTPITAEATSASGAVVTYSSPTATDNVDGSVAVTCTPASGSTFKIGTTPVTCKATDSAGNVAIKIFTVTVHQHTTTPPQNAKINSTFGNHGRPLSDGTTTTNVPSSLSSLSSQSQ